MNRSARQRALVTCILLAGCFTGFSFRLVHLQVARHEELASRAASQNVVRETIFARRGLIQDVHGEPLAGNEPRRIVFADGSLITDSAQLARLLAGPLEMNEKKLLERLTTRRFDEQRRKWEPSRYIVLKRKVLEQTANEISDTLAAQKLRGIYLDHDTARIYPNGPMLCHVLGYLSHRPRTDDPFDAEFVGAEGIERSMSRYLEGSDGFRFIERDRTGKELVPYRGQERAPRDGATVRLTIDMGLQAIVESELEAAMKQFRPKKAIVILMRPQTGEILALANRPHYDLNQQHNVPAEARKNIAIMDMVEPGSTFKVVTAAAALNERIVRPETMIFCENRYWSWCRLRD
ncbi:MAG: penicillin-binding transpeptidase domain-containing protein, partial [Verrucomicrobiota bacterium]|nr:penicillin-binding transpeptidase domain-containing protein [Verrucomicrobiota bacterium]